MSSPFTLARACRACNNLKVRCQPSLTDPNACERCWRAGKECVPAGRRRRPRDRIADLEAQVAELTRALQAQRLSHLPSNAPANERDSRRSVEEEPLPGKSSHVSQSLTDSDVVAMLDSHVSMASQQQALDAYVHDAFPTFPLVPIQVSDLARLRKEAPALLFAIITFATSYLLPEHTRNELIQQAMRMFALDLIAKPNRCLEVVWALLIAASWFRTRPGISHVTIHQLVQLATGMAIDIGIGGTQLLTTPGAGDSVACYPESLHAQRTWLGCFVGASTLSIGLRRLDANAQWTARHEDCLNNLSLIPPTLPTDRLFLHIVRGEKLCYQIVTSLALCDPVYLWDLASDKWQRTTSTLRKEIDDWTAEMSSDVDHKPLLFCRYSAIIYLNEPVLHTHTNKLTFGSPLKADRIAESDFPTPIVTGSHVAALHALRDSCYAMLDLATEPNTAAFLATCPLVYTSKVFYALFILVKLYISITGSGNTYGTILRPTEVRLEQYLGCVKALAASMEELNPGSFNARILAGHVLVDDWFKGYVDKLRLLRTPESISEQSPGRLDESDSKGAYMGDCTQPAPGTEEDEWLVLENYHTWMNDLFQGDFSFT